MPSSRSQHDPFTTTSNAAGPSLRTNASAASTRTRQQLFAPSLSRRPTTSRTTPRVEDDVLPDSDSEQENVTTPRQRQPVRRLRHASPGDRHGRFKPKQQPQAQAEELEIVNRQPDGSYLLGGSTMGVLAAPTVFGQDVAEASGMLLLPWNELSVMLTSKQMLRMLPLRGGTLLEGIIRNLDVERMPTKVSALLGMSRLLSHCTMHTVKRSSISDTHILAHGLEHSIRTYIH